MEAIYPFFSDPILRSSTIGSMLMCLTSAIVGVILFLRKRSLIGETLSHASFPGVVVGVICGSLIAPLSDLAITMGIITGASLFAFLGLAIIHLLERKLNVSSDNALCFVLSSFFGIAVLIASRLQQVRPLWYKQALIFLYGQAATMTQVHLIIYSSFALIVIGFTIYFYRYLEAVNFDPAFAETLGIPSKRMDRISFFLIVIAIVTGIRSVGVVLMGGMLIAPAIAARPFTNRLSSHFILAAICGIVTGFGGNYLSIVIPQGAYSLPTGPTILLFSSTLCLLGLIAAPNSGLLIRYIRMRRFHMKVKTENVLKKLWKGEKVAIAPIFRLRLRQQGWIDRSNHLTNKGKYRAEKIVRLHRLWEVYLVDYLGQKAEKVHKSAEELEHLMSPELEEKLTCLLKNPTHDPHHQPIPLPCEERE